MEVTANSQGLFDNAKLEQLPDSLQSELMKLTREQFRTLFGAMSQNHYFDFFGLPLELRRMILRYILCSPNGRIMSGHYDWESDWRSDWESDCEPPNLEGLEVLRANKQLSAEAMAIMKEVNIVVWTFDSVEKLPESIALRRQFASSISSFRRTELTFVLYDVHVNTTSENEKEPNAVMAKVVTAIETAIRAGRAPNKLLVDVKFTIYYGDIYPYTLHDYAGDYSRGQVAALTDGDQEDRLYLSGFLRLQLQHMLKKHENTLAGLPGVSLRSDVDNDVDNGVQWLRCSDDLAVFKDKTRQTMGPIQALVDVRAHAEDTVEIKYASFYDEDIAHEDLTHPENEDIYA